MNDPDILSLREVLEPRHLLRLHDYAFDASFSKEVLSKIRDELGVLSLKKPKFSGFFRPEKDRLTLRAEVKASVTQSCSVTSEPITTRIDCAITRIYMIDGSAEEKNLEPISEMNASEDEEPLPDTLSLRDIFQETIALEMPDFPRKDGIDLFQASARPKGAPEIDDERIKPFAGLSELLDSKKT